MGRPKNNAKQLKNTDYGDLPLRFELLIRSKMKDAVIFHDYRMTYNQMIEAISRTNCPIDDQKIWISCNEILKPSQSQALGIDIDRINEKKAQRQNNGDVNDEKNVY